MIRFRFPTSAVSYMLGVALAIGLAIPAAAHEFWLEPESTRATVGDTVPVIMAVGSDFVGETQIFIPLDTVRFDVIGPDGTVPAGRGFAADPAGEVKVTAPGLYAVVFQNTGQTVDMTPETFRTYAGREGLEHALQARAAAGLSESRVLDRYTRFPKTFVLAGPDTAGDGTTRNYGQVFEIVPERNLFTVRPGDSLPFRVVFRGRPAADILVGAFLKQKSERTATVRTDADGRGVLPVRESGRWMLSAVALIAAEGPGRDWDSFWASVTFDVP
ncbi:MAG: DUF4198 domain-containing protein [Pseudomonadota bacterium]|nr:DUF4198 domain-containing protein [Pseudomonadota bacterium]